MIWFCYIDLNLLQSSFLINMNFTWSCFGILFEIHFNLLLLSLFCKNCKNLLYGWTFMISNIRKNAPNYMKIFAFSLCFWLNGLRNRGGKAFVGPRSSKPGPSLLGATGWRCRLGTKGDRSRGFYTGYSVSQKNQRLRIQKVRNF